MEFEVTSSASRSGSPPIKKGAHLRKREAKEQAKQQLIVEKYKVEGLRPLEISRQLGMKADFVRRTLARFRKEVKRRVIEGRPYSKPGVKP